MNRTQDELDPHRAVLRITRMLARGPTGQLHFPPHRAPGLARLIAQYARAPNAVALIGAVLKLTRTLRAKHGAPDAARAVTDALRSDSEALRIVTRVWSSRSRRPRFGADLAPLGGVRAPAHDAKPAQGSVPLRSLISPLQDTRGEHLRRRTRRKTP